MSSRPLSASPPPKRLKPAEITDISSGEVGAAGLPRQLEGLPISEGIGRVANWLGQIAARQEDEQGRSSKQLAAAKAKLEEAQKDIKTIRAELEAERAKTFAAAVEAKRARDRAERLDAELKVAVGGQGEVLCEETTALGSLHRLGQ